VRKTTKTGVAGCLGLILLLTMAASSRAGAFQTEFWAKPGGGSGSGACTQGDPCALTTALSHANFDGDRVVVTPGHYVPGPLAFIAAIDVGGQTGAAVPRIDVSGALFVPHGALVHDLRIDDTGGFGGLNVLGGTAERLSVTSPAGSSLTCSLDGGVLRDSVCKGAADTGAVGLNALGGTPGLLNHSLLRNVTAIDTGTGAGIFLGAGSGFNMAYDAVNVIARGTTYDVKATADGSTGVGAVITLDHSDYATVLPAVPTGGASVTPPGTNGNQTAAPLFADASSGDFHELAGSPTIDAGITDPSLGSFDLDNHPRGAAMCLGGAAGPPDIGAFEFATVSPPIAACGKFTVGAVKHNKKKGTATLTVTVPGSGALSLSGKGLKQSSVSAASASDDTLTVKATGKSRRKLAAKGKAKLKATISFTPTGGSGSTQIMQLKLKEKK
jgi:hypothetical protein